MTKYVAFLRGINVGGRVIKMADLKACFEELDFGEVKTYLQSGNVVFAAAGRPERLKQQIETALTNSFGYSARVLIYSLDQLQDIIENYPFDTAAADQHDYVVFMTNGLEKDLAAEAVVLDENEKIKLGDGAVYWQVEKCKTLKSRFATKYQAQAKYRPFSTTRNIKTLRKIVV